MVQFLLRVKSLRFLYSYNINIFTLNITSVQKEFECIHVIYNTYKWLKIILKAWFKLLFAKPEIIRIWFLFM